MTATEWPEARARRDIFSNNQAPSVSSSRTPAMSIFKILGCCSLGEIASKRLSSEAAYAAVQEPLGLSCRVSPRVASLKTGTELNIFASRNWLESAPRLQQCAPQQRRQSPQPESRDLGWCSALVLLSCGEALTCNAKIAGNGHPRQPRNLLSIAANHPRSSWSSGMYEPQKSRLAGAPRQLIKQHDFRPDGEIVVQYR